jgi:imidazolonepropionase-like amidohydrolase
VALLKTRGPVLVVALCLSVLACPTEPEPFVTADDFVLLGGTLVDGTGAAALADAALVIRGDKVVFAGPRSRVTISPGADTLNVAGATILPGFIDAHVHGAYSATTLTAWARAGVTTVRDEGIQQTGAVLRDLLALRDSAWSAPGYARLVSAGWMITAPGGYGRLAVSTAAEARLRVTEELDQGADLIKVAVEDGTTVQNSLPVLATEALLAAVATAHARGRLVSAHITDARFLQTVVEAGVDDAAHVTWDPVPDAIFRQMIARHITLVPTLTVFEPGGALVPGQANLRRFLQLGGTVALGDDYGGLPASQNPHFQLGMPMPEILWMAEAGMTPLQIIVAATRNAAHVCGLEAELGTLEAGKTADVLVVNGDPLRDLTDLQNVRLVLHRGVVIRN